MKKGQVSFVVDVFAFFGVVALLIIFTIIFSFIGDGSEYSTKAEVERIDAKMQVLQILKTPVTIDGYNSDYGHFIALARVDDDMHREVKDKLTPLLEKIYYNTGRSIIIENPDQNRAYAFYEPNLDDEISFDLTIPGYDGEPISLSVEVAK